MRDDSIMGSFQPVQPVMFSARLLGGIMISCVVALAMLAGLVASHWPALLAGDQIAETAAHYDVLTQPWLLIAAKTATAIGSPVVVDVVAAVVMVVLLVLRWWRAAVVVAAARAGELVCESAVKVLVARPRPALVDPVAHASGYSFPSGHAGGSAAVYGALALLGVAGVAERRPQLVLDLRLLDQCPGSRPTIRPLTARWWITARCSDGPGAAGRVSWRQQRSGQPRLTCRSSPPAGTAVKTGAGCCQRWRWSE